MTTPLKVLPIAAVMFCGTNAGIAQTFDYSAGDSVYDRRIHSIQDELYEQRYSQDLLGELKRAEENKKMLKLIKNFPAEDPLQVKLSRRMNAIISTNFTADTNATPMEIVPGLPSNN